MLLNAASQDYLNLRLDLAAARLRWLTEHLTPLVSTAETTATATVAVPAAQAAAGPSAATERAQFRACHARAESLLRQMSLGLDFHGQVANHVTLLSERFYLDALGQLMPLAAGIEEAYVAYTSAKNQKSLATDAAQRAKEQYLKVIAVKRSERDKRVAQTPSMLSALRHLDERRNELWTAVHTADSYFRNAVETQTQGCDFGRVVALAAACTTLATTAGASAAAWSTAAGFFADRPLQSDGAPLPEGSAGTKYVLKTFSNVAKTTGDFIEAARDIGEKVDGTPSGNSRVPGLPTDEAKILTSAEALQKQLEPYLDKFSEAVEYRRLLQDFVSVCTTRNNQVLEYNNHLTALRTLESELVQAELDAARLQDVVAGSQDPFLADVVAMMDHIWQDSLAYVVKLLSQVHASYQYFSLDDDSRLIITDFSVKTLEASRFQLWKKYIEQKQLAASPPAVLTRVQVPLRSLVGTRGLQQLQDQGRVTFSLPPDHPKFRDLCKVLISTVEVSMVAPNGPLADYGVVLVHHGNALIFDADGRPHVYSHVPVRTPYRREGGKETIHGNANLDDYVGVSPYGPWTLELDSSTRVQDLSEVTLLMSGFGRSRYNPTRT